MPLAHLGRVSLDRGRRERIFERFGIRISELAFVEGALFSILVLLHCENTPFSIGRRTMPLSITLLVAPKNIPRDAGVKLHGHC